MARFTVLLKILQKVRKNRMINASYDGKGVTTRMIGPGELVNMEFHAIMMNMIKVMRENGATDPEIEQMLVKRIVTAFPSYDALIILFFLTF